VPSVTVNRVRLFYEEAGAPDAPPLVLIMGWGGDHTAWAVQVPAFAAEHRVIALDNRGAGQSEVEVTGIADTVLLVLMPGSGDSVQALKAGIMEIPDVIAVNKMDHAAAKTMLNEVRSIVGLAEPDRRPAILLTEALRGENVPELWAALEKHRRGRSNGGKGLSG